MTNEWFTQLRRAQRAQRRQQFVNAKFLKDNNPLLRRSPRAPKNWEAELSNRVTFTKREEEPHTWNAHPLDAQSWHATEVEATTEPLPGNLVLSAFHTLDAPWHSSRPTRRYALRSIRLV